MKRLLALLFALQSVMIVFGQFSQFRDSILQRLAVAKEDTGKVRLYNILGFNYAWSDADSSIMFGQQALDLSQKLHFDKGVARSQLIMCVALTTEGNYSRALDYAFKSLAFFETTKDTNNLAFAYQSVAGCYRDMGDYRNSLQYYYRSLHLFENNPDGAAMPSGLLGAVYQRNNQPDSAIIFLRAAYPVLGDFTYVNVESGNAWSKKGNYDSAMFYYRRAIPLAVENHTDIDLIDIYYGMSAVFNKKGNLDSAAWYAKKALAEKSGKSYPIGLLRAATILADLYETQKKPDSALKYLKASVVLRDSLFNREKTTAFQNLVYKEQEKQKEIQASKLQYQNQLKLNASLGILFTVLVIAVILFRNNRQRKKAFAL
ncbi:MAG TPA: tetratricopeptide repeat protein, partial [Puia sp.]|nr:tetratricopeptide repeat protein [Puia sp.]